MRARTAVVSSVADQGVAALTNILVLVAAARLSTVADFARFSAVYLVFTVLLGISGAYTGQPLVLRRGAGEEVRGACRSAVDFTLLAASALGALLAAVCLFVPGDTARALMVLGLVLPVVLGQDAMRYAFSTLQRPHLALASDVLRLACVLGALAVQPYGAPAARLVAVWGLSALPALLLSAALLRRHVAGTQRRLKVLMGRGHLGRRFVVEFGVGNATSQLSVLGLGVFGNPLVVGALRGATTLFGPLNVLFTSATSFGPPLLGRLGSERRRIRATAGLAAVLAATAAVWASALALLPDGVGRHLLGDTWPTAAALLPHDRQPVHGDGRRHLRAAGAADAGPAHHSLHPGGVLARRRRVPGGRLRGRRRAGCCLGAVSGIRLQGGGDLDPGGRAAPAHRTRAASGQRVRGPPRPRKLVTSSRQSAPMASFPTDCSSGPRSRMNVYPAISGAAMARTLPGPGPSRDTASA